MRRERVEAQLDQIFGQRLTDRNFLESIASELSERASRNASKSDVSNLQRMSRRLQEKRKRVLDAYFNALIDRAERDRRLEQIKADQQFCEQQLRNIRSETYEVSAQELTHILAPFQEWEYLSRVDKRRLLQAIVPEIHLRDYNVTKLALLVDDPHRNELNHTGTGSWPRPA